MAVGLGFDRGLRAITTNAIITVLGAGIGVGVYYGAFESRAAAWCLPCLMQVRCLQGRGVGRDGLGRCQPGRA